MNISFLKIRFSTLTIAFLLVSTTLFGQSKKAVKEYTHARQAITDGNMEQAWKHIVKALKYDPNYVDANVMAGDFKMSLENAEEAVPYYETALRISGKAFVKYKLALAYRDVLRYEEGLNLLREYEEERAIPERNQASFYLLMASMAFAKDAVQNPVEFNPIDLGGGVNSEGMEYFPSINARGDILVITRRYPDAEKSDEDFYASTFVDGVWQKAQRLDGFLNTDLNEGAQSLAADGTELYFTGCHRNDGYGSCDIYVSLFRNGLWSSPRNLGESINTGQWESQPSISPDGKTLYFVRGKNGVTTNITILESKRNPDGTWAKAQPIQGAVNTPFADEAPYIHFDNETLYFTSDGHPGMGRKDLFYSKKQPDGTWGEPINLGYPINTPFDEFSLVVGPDGKTGFFSSNRINGGDNLDIFSFQLPKETQATSIAWVLGKVIDAETGLPVKTLIDFHDLKNNKDFQQIETDEQGNFFAVMPQDRNFALFVNQKGYLPFSENYSLSGVDIDNNFNLKIELEAIKSGTKFTLRNILFETDSYMLQPESEAELDRLVDFLKTNPNLSVIIEGHTDNQGSTAHNQKLSENRAASVLNYLVEKGIAKSRLSSKGFGDTMPIASNDTEKGRSLNRRTEVELK